MQAGRLDIPDADLETHRSKKMAQDGVKLRIPFESLVESLADLSLRDKLRLWELLDRQLAQAEEELFERNADVQAEIREARADYEAGDYVTLDEYVARQRRKARRATKSSSQRQCRDNSTACQVMSAIESSSGFWP